MGINDLTTFKYKIYGQGQIRTKWVQIDFF
jgi:gamma-glutamyl phosphate reductase